MSGKGRGRCVHLVFLHKKERVKSLRFERRRENRHYLTIWQQSVHLLSVDAVTEVLVGLANTLIRENPECVARVFLGNGLCLPFESGKDSPFRQAAWYLLGTG
jgi:hypothetical protein